MKKLVIGFFMVMSGLARAQQPVYTIWMGHAPGSASWTQQEIAYLDSVTGMQMVRNVVTPTLTAFSPDSSNSTGIAVIICPGGAFFQLAWENEGTKVAERLANRGINAFVLKYRLQETPASDEDFRSLILFRPLPSAIDTAAISAGWYYSTHEYTTDVRQFATADIRQAVSLVHQRADEWGIHPDKIGVLGFSAGAVVAMDLVMENDASSRPDFVGIVYGGSGYEAGIPPDAPPLFIVAAADDNIIANDGVQLFNEWIGAGLTAEIHVYSKGGHGFGMEKQSMPVDTWIERFIDWLTAQGL